MNLTKLNEKISDYELINGYKPYLFMSRDTIDELTSIIWFSSDWLMGANPSGYCGMYCGRKTFRDDTMQFGLVEMR